MVTPTLINAIAKLESPGFAPSPSPAPVEFCPVATRLGLDLCATLLAPPALRWAVACGATTGTTGLPACARAAGPKDTGVAGDGAAAAAAITAACAAAAGEGVLDLLAGAGTVAGGAT